MADSPLLKALPPETDYLTYLTLLEYNITAEQLPILHDILQDTTLTANIGWDLVHLLLPFLPASQQCLQDVARLGNPREVVLKVTELLEQIGAVEEEDGRNESAEQADEEEFTVGKLNIAEDSTGARAEDEDAAAGTAPENPTPSTSSAKAKPLPKTVQFIALLEMLSILHPRIKTKYPSRFLSTSLQAILPAYTQVAATQEATEAVLGFIKALSGAKRPRLPPRKSSNAVMLQDNGTDSAPDPEGKDEPLTPDEVALQTRLLQSFLTYVTEDYMLATSASEVSGLAWSGRLQEKLHPEKMRPDRKPYTILFAEEDALHARDAIMGQIVALARDLGLFPDQLLQTITSPEPESSSTTSDLPSTASDVPLSHTGSLHLLSATAAATALFDAPTCLRTLQIHPDYTSILRIFIAPPETGSIGSEPESLIDSILFLGFFILSTHDAPTLPPDDEVFTSLLQRLSLLSANTPSPTLRYHAHVLTSNLLHSHASDYVRLAFMKDTLEHCPYENLKASAVEWLKDELLTAETHHHEDESPSIFSTPTALTTVAPLLFPDLHLAYVENPPSNETLRSFLAYQPFHLAALNFYYLLLVSSSLFSSLEITQLTEDYNVREGYVAGLLDLSAALKREIRSMDEDAEAETGLLEVTAQMVMAAMGEKGVGGGDG